MPSPELPSANGGPPRRPETPWLRALHRELWLEAEADIQLSLRVAVLLAAGVRKPEVARQLAVEPADFGRAVRRLEAVALRLERDDDAPRPLQV